MYAVCPRRNAGTLTRTTDATKEGGMRIKKDHTNCHPIKSIHDFLSPSRGIVGHPTDRLHGDWGTISQFVPSKAAKSDREEGPLTFFSWRVKPHAKWALIRSGVTPSSSSVLIQMSPQWRCDDGHKKAWKVESSDDGRTNG